MEVLVNSAAEGVRGRAIKKRQFPPTIPWRLQSMILSVLMLCCLSSQHGTAAVSAGGTFDDDGSIGSTVGVLPLAMAAELRPSRLSLQLLQHGRSRAEATAAAEMLMSAMAQDETAPLYNLFVAWSHSYQQRYSSAAEAEEAFMAFKAAVDCLLHHNTHSGSGGSGGNGGGGGDSNDQRDNYGDVDVVKAPNNVNRGVHRDGGGGGETAGSGDGGGGGGARNGGGNGAWYTLNAFSATPVQLGGLSARRKLGSTSKQHKILQPPSARRTAPKVSRCPRSAHLHPPPPPRPKVLPRLRPPPPRGRPRPAPAVKPPGLVPPSVTRVPPPKLMPRDVPPPAIPSPGVVRPPPQNTSPTPHAPPPALPLPRQQPMPAPRPPGNIGAPNASQTPFLPPVPVDPLGPIYLAAALWRSSRAGGTAQLTFPPPPSVDWTTTGKLTPVKFQGATCSSCWANSAVSAAEAALSIAYDMLPVAYSRQILVDCARLSVAGVNFAHDDGCFGGDAADALLFMNLYSIPTEDAYPYVSGALGIAGTCNAAMMSLPASDTTWLKAGSIINYPANSEVALQAAVAVQPVVIYWNMGYNFRSYGGGMYDIADQTDSLYGCVTSAYSSNHAMMVVGYAAASSFWIIQNSFGTGWGEQGFIRVRMTNDTVGPCGMYWYVVAPSLKFKRVPTGFMPGAPPPSPIVAPEVGCMMGVELQGSLLRRVNATSMRACQAEALAARQPNASRWPTFFVWDGASGCQLKDNPLAFYAGGNSPRPNVTAVANMAGGTCFMKPLYYGGTFLCSQYTFINAGQTPPSLVLPENVNRPSTSGTCQTACDRNKRCIFFMWASRVDGTASCSLYYNALTTSATFAQSWARTDVCFRTIQTT